MSLLNNIYLKPDDVVVIVVSRYLSDITLRKRTTQDTIFLNRKNNHHDHRNTKLILTFCCVGHVLQADGEQ